MYRASAPFFMGVRGDRRVTGTRRGSAAVSAASVGAFAPFFIAVMSNRRVTVDVKTALCGIGFSRECNAVSTRWDD
jgi:hypothetical protein